VSISDATEQTINRGDSSAERGHTLTEKKGTTIKVGTAIGTALEYYDFAIYGLAAATVFNRIFFPASDPAVGLIASLAAYAVGFAVRPLGGLLLGGLGDRIGRKYILYITIFLMGISTFCIGLLPTYQTIGIYAPILLVFMRIVQGFGAGAELASGATLLVESAAVNKRGYIGGLLSIGSNTGTLIAATCWYFVSLMPEGPLLSWGWRLPFLASCIVTLWGLWIRRRMDESPTFMDVADRQAKATLQEIYRGVFGTGRRAFLACLGIRIGEVGPSMIIQVFLIGYIANLPNGSKATGTLALILASVACYLTIPVVGKLSDMFGRRLVHRSLTGVLILFAFPALYMVHTGNVVLIVIAFIVAFSIADMGMYVVENVWMAEMFGSRYRLGGVTGAKEIGGLIGGAFAPVICAALVVHFGSWWPVATYIVLLGLVAFVSGTLARETRERSLIDEADAL
jgi:MHS family metabolite:H+ symporter-like MFS transporter